MTHTRLRAAGALLTIAFLAGCGGSKTGDLAGNVTLNGSPLKGGQVTAYDAKNEAVGRSFVIDGRFELRGLPLGSVALAVQTHLPDGQPVNVTQGPPRDGERRPPANAKVEGGAEVPVLDPVPLKYTSTKESGLRVEVVKGETPFDIAMTGKGEIPKAPPMPPPGGGFPGGFPPGGLPPHLKK